ncbi:MAG: superoxide dismutase family protein [Clostridia bacterium]|nr:superoxide dismutase family protein [Clostridia bacterium]
MRNQGLYSLLRKQPDAYAIIKGSQEYNSILGKAVFYRTQFGIIVITSVSGLPEQAQNCANNIFAIHIHEGEECTGNEKDPFFNTKSHYNPNNCPHPYHAGDMPPLFATNGNALSAYLTNSYTIEEIAGKTIVIHKNPDDFKTQPSGNSGTKIACGKIIRLR